MRPIFVLGPTATGKSGLAIELAQLLGAHIINTDSMQLYKGMDIGTAKVPYAERGGVEHHLLDVWDVSHVASVVQYQNMAYELYERLSQESPIIFVGGSMMYVQSLIDSWSFPQTNKDIRVELEAWYAREGLEPLRRQLHQYDPIACDRILPTDSRRIIRALEVSLGTGGTYTGFMPQRSGIPWLNSLVIGLDVPSYFLDSRVDKRTEVMFHQGLVSEVEHLSQRGLHRETTAGKAIGYAQVLDYLAGKTSLEEARLETAQRTKRYIRRQRSWFKKDSRVVWLDGRTSVKVLLSMVIDLL